MLGLVWWLLDGPIRDGATATIGGGVVADDEAALVQPDVTSEAAASPCPEDRNLMTKDKELCVALHIFRRQPWFVPICGTFLEMVAHVDEAAEVQAVPVEVARKVRDEQVH